MVGILTFHRAANYGAVLQAYALQQTLDELNIENEIIDYRCEYIENHYAPKPSVSLRHVKHYLLELREAPVKKKIRQKFDRFLATYLRTSGIIYKTDLKEQSAKYKAIVTGSDQVWHLAISGEDTAYALDFAPEYVKRISYAASIGPQKMNIAYQDKLSVCLKKYAVISVREPAAVSLIKELSGQEVRCDVDPTILLAVDYWNRIANTANLKYEKFIFVYVMQPSEVLYDIASHLAEKENLKILTISMVKNKSKIGKNVKGAGVPDFLWLIKNAEYVITNSFHGLLFSLRFHKKFYWAFQCGAHMSNPRFDMLVEQYGIDCRCCDSLDSLNACQNIDFNKIDSIMEYQRETSARHLRESFEGIV